MEMVTGLTRLVDASVAIGPLGTDKWPGNPKTVLGPGTGVGGCLGPTRASVSARSHVLCF